MIFFGCIIFCLLVNVDIENQLSVRLFWAPAFNMNPGRYIRLLISCIPMWHFYSGQSVLSFGMKSLKSKIYEIGKNKDLLVIYKFYKNFHGPSIYTQKFLWPIQKSFGSPSYTLNVQSLSLFGIHVCLTLS